MNDIHQKAVTRMKALKLDPEAIKRYEEKEQLSMSSVNGIREIPLRFQEIIEMLLEQESVKIYHIIFRTTDLGIVLKALTVSWDKENWPEERRDLAEYQPWLYVWNEYFGEWALCSTQIHLKDGCVL